MINHSEEVNSEIVLFVEPEKSYWQAERIQLYVISISAKTKRCIVLLIAIHSYFVAFKHIAEQITTAQSLSESGSISNCNLIKYILSSHFQPPLLQDDHKCFAKSTLGPWLQNLKSTYGKNIRWSFEQSQTSRLTSPPQTFKTTCIDEVTIVMIMEMKIISQLEFVNFTTKLEVISSIIITSSDH